MKLFAFSLFFSILLVLAIAPDVYAYQGKLVVEKPVYGLGGSPLENAVIHVILDDEDFENIVLKILLLRELILFMMEHSMVL